MRSHKNSRPPAAEAHEIPKVLAKRASTELVFVFGTGASLALTNGDHPQLSWKGLLDRGLAEAERRGKMSHDQLVRWQSLLTSTDIDDLLGVAEHIGRKLDSPSGDLYARWLSQEFEPVTPSNSIMADAIRKIAQSGSPICTLNYDRLLENVTGLASVEMTDLRGASEWMRGNPGVLHLHGVWTNPESVILGVRDYAKTVSDEARDLFQRTLASFKHLIFVGCGDTFADPNFSTLISWLRSTFRGSSPQHFALVTEEEVRTRSADPSWHGFVEPLSYGAARSELPAFLSRLCTRLPTQDSTTRTPNRPLTIAANDLLDEYRKFLVKDCGKMTIEGLRADMDTAQRKFDLERLFVPLEVHSIPPEYREGDPDREEKLQKWHEKHSKAVSFGTVFSKNPRIALMALPGGGKTLLLKRIAVAYADPPRRAGAEDGLPSEDLFPILIRCREWRDEIRRPIPILLAAMADATGQPGLKGLDEALVPLLENGTVLLMIDGLDEIHDDADRSTFVENLENFLEQYPKVRLLVTSREAGFALVAPSFSRFCARFRIAPLSDRAITQLCEHWRTLMAGDAPEAIEESRNLTRHLLSNGSIRRLAENPLLLTMLLVVKHGAGRLPPDRVSLYERAVEVLLDTWNIKGHEPLNLKESVPQLACVAFELLKQGKQTATKQELLKILEAARDCIPQISRYAKGSPDEFLRRVEIRSSLLVEAGRQLDGSRLVPFYQFRHLTFQEYLAAAAAAEGNYLDYKTGDTVLTPLSFHLLSDEWKEVVPMAAVLAKKQADALISELIIRGAGEETETIERFRGVSESERVRFDRPSAVARLTQCLIEEAQIPPEHLEAALRLVALFACESLEDGSAWTALAQGPYGGELFRQAWLLYVDQTTDERFWMRNTCAALAFGQQRPHILRSDAGQIELRRMLESSDNEVVAKGLLIVCGQRWTSRLGEPQEMFPWPPLEIIESLTANESPFVWEPAVWAWAMSMYSSPDRPVSLQPNILVLERIKDLLLEETRPLRATLLGFGLYCVLGIDREYWSPSLTPKQELQLRRILETSKNHAVKSAIYDELYFGSLVLAFHACAIPDGELNSLIPKSPALHRDRWTRLQTQLDVWSKGKRKNRSKSSTTPP